MGLDHRTLFSSGRKVFGRRRGISDSRCSYNHPRNSLRQKVFFFSKFFCLSTNK